MWVRSEMRLIFYNVKTHRRDSVPKVQSFERRGGEGATEEESHKAHEGHHLRGRHDNEQIKV